MSKSKEGLIASWELWRGHLHRDSDGITFLDSLLQNEWDALKIITIGVDEDGVLWPGSLSIVSKSPRLSEGLIWQDFVLVTKAFFDESGVVRNNFLLWLSLSSETALF